MATDGSDPMHLIILGAGYSGKAIAQTFAAKGFTVSGTTRSPEKAAGLAALGIRPLIFDGTGINSELAEALGTTTHVVQSIAPDEHGDAFLTLAKDLPMPGLVWAGFLSTVGVYGNHDGKWVNEESACHPVSARSQQRLAAEAAWLSFADSRKMPLSILRLSGIYGSGRNAFVNLENGTARRIVKPGQMFNRIHVEDIGAATGFLAERNLGGIYNVTDDLPAPAPDVVVAAAAMMGVEPPPETPFEPDTMTPMARSFYGENKRVSNAKLRGKGFAFRFPSYHDALRDLWEKDRWRG